MILCKLNKLTVCEANNSSMNDEKFIFIKLKFMLKGNFIVMK